MRPRSFASTYYFLYFGAASGLLPYLSLFYQQVGLDTRQIGVLAAVMTVVMLVAGPLWGLLADTFHLHQRLLPLAMAMTLPPVLLLIGAGDFWTLALLVLWLALCFAPIVPLADHAVLTLLGDKSHHYGRLRLWGAVGWAVCAWVAGNIAERFGTQYAFVLYLCLMALCIVVAVRLPAPRLAAPQQQKPELRRFAADRRWWGFLGSVFLFGLGMAALNNYFSLYLKTLGAGESLFGLSMTAAALSELPIFFFAPLVLRRWSPRALMNVAFIAMGVRCFGLGLIQNPTLAIAIQLLHGLSFSAMWAAGVGYASEIAPEGLGASAQSLFGATIYSLAGAVGALVGSQIFAVWGPSTLFRAAGVAALIGLLVFAASNYAVTRRRAAARFQPETTDPI